MVLMISVKNACQSGWFSDKDSEELRNLAKEIANNFGSVSHFSMEPSCSLSVFSTIMSRFYPRMKMGHMLVFLEVKPGFDAYVSDFQISKKLKSSPGDKIRLFVAQTDSIETSSCLISPAKVNFILNGKGVERRTNLFMDTGPQIPTAVTHLLKYGSNLLQAVGEFNGNYIIAVAIMSEMPNPDSNALQDYEQHAPAIVDSDSEIIEGPSRISLNCPISFSRIKTPVKGHLCKHIQCFDFDNYVDINSRRPSWRCPHCNQHVCFADIRIDQKMVKVLKEVEANVSDIIVSSDGSWNAVMDSDDAIQKPEDKNSDTGDSESPQPVDLLDLTRTDDGMDGVTTYETEDRKISRSVCQSQSITQTMAGNPHIANTDNVNQRIAHVGDDFWSGIYLSTLGQGSSNVPSNEQIAGVFVSTSNYVASPPVLTDSFTTNGEVEAFNGNALFTTSVPQRETSLPNTLQLQQYQFGNPNITNEYDRFPPIPRHVTRTPTAVQALPAQASTSVIQQRSRNSVSAFIQNGLSADSQASPAESIISNSTFRANPLQVSQMSSSPFHQYGIQQNRSFPPVRPPQQNIGLQATSQVPDAQRVLNERQRSSQQMAILRMPRAVSQSPGLIQSSMQSSASFLRPQSHVGVSQDRIVRPTGLVSGQQAPMVAPANRTMQMALDTSRNATSYSMNPDGSTTASVGDQRSNVGVASQPVMRTDAYDPAQQNWRPAGRMRGALSGQAYTDALNQYIIRPNQQAQLVISNVTSHPDKVPADSFMADRAAQGTPAPNYPSARPASMPGGSDIFPNISPWMH
ncbi:hypothetical protein Pfo_025343 [Paulownia fortunei]|nr:hypothetical protein Pfo_025343 [Paulownia fortunei]